tara:strand:+ start:20385 stop:20843 length:459 start_codon:yes stop_codon:yes gene_type:complete
VKDVKIEINGLKEVQDAIRAYQGDISKQLGLIVDAAALEAVSDVRRAIQGPPKTGREYPRGRDKVHRASAPGQAPATDTGTLVSSIYNEDRGPNAKAIGSRLPYAFHLEFGTFKMDARPSWIPAIERTIPKMLKRVQLAIAKAKARAEKTTK